MVFEYMEYDLTGILETPSVKISQDHIKSWSMQLLSGVHFMHVNKVIHRDLKASNLLINRKGQLKIADFGLARSWNPDMTRLTNKVITLWYRPPELLLGCTSYNDKIDMWSVGCIIAEMFKRSGFIRGGDEPTQLELIFKVAGHPTLEDWPGTASHCLKSIYFCLLTALLCLHLVLISYFILLFTQCEDIHKMCPLWKNFEPNAASNVYPRAVKETLKLKLPNPLWLTENAKDLIDNLLILNPMNRWSAKQAIDAEYFFENPIFKPAEKLNMNLGIDSVHEWEAREKHRQMMQQRASTGK
jgi:cyclin-dependent kinase 12/13